MLVAYYSDFQVDGSHGYIKRTTSGFILRYLSNIFLFYSMVTYLIFPDHREHYHPVQVTTFKNDPNYGPAMCIHVPNVESLNAMPISAHKSLIFYIMGRAFIVRVNTHLTLTNNLSLNTL